MMESAMPADYLVACACDEIVMPETGIVVLPGIHAEATFYKGLLGKLGIEADFIHIGDYKGAAEPLTREKFSEPVRENMTSLDRQPVRRHGHDDRQGPAALDRSGQGNHRHRPDHRQAGQGAGPDRSRRLSRHAPRRAGRRRTRPSRWCT